MSSFDQASDRINAAVEKAEIGSEILSQVANGDEFTEVPTTSGPVPSLKKWQKDNMDLISGGVIARVDKAILSYPDYAAASAAAATLPDGQALIAPDDSGRLSSYKVSGGQLIYDGIAAAFKRSKQILLSWTVHDEDISTDNTALLSQALTSAFSTGSTLVVDIDVATTEINITSGRGGVVCVEGKRIHAHANSSEANIYGNPLLTFGDSVVDSDFWLDVDIHGKSKSGVYIAGAGCRIPYVRVANILSSAAQTALHFGLSVSGEGAVIGEVIGDNLSAAPSNTRGGAALSVVNYAARVTVSRIVQKGSFCAYLGNGDGTTIDYVYSEDCTDNAIYVISGSKDFICNTLVARNCLDEVAVISGDDAGVNVGNVNAYIGRIVAYNCVRGLGVLRCSNVRVDEIEWYSDGSVDSGSPFYIRQVDTVKIDRVHIGTLKIYGAWSSGAPIWTLQGAGIGDLVIGELIARLEFKNPSATKQLTFSSGIDRISVDKIDVEVVDSTGTLTSADVFRLNLGTLTKPSNIGEVLLSNGGGVHNVRLVDISQDNLKLDGIPSIRADLDPPFIGQQSNQTTREYGSGAAPTQGTWKRGDVVWNQFPANGGGVGWVCVTAGTPGVWVEFGAIGTTGSGAWTPALTIVTNLDSATVQGAQFVRIGQMVTVSGTIQLDPTATGAVSVRLTPPVASNFTGAFQCGGTATAVDGTFVGVVTADAANKQILLSANATTTSARNVTFHATYRVL